MLASRSDGLYSLSSPNGSWTRRLAADITAISYNDGIYACVTQDNQVYRSTNGTSWTSVGTIQVPLTGSEHYSSGLSDSGQLVFVGDDAVASSIDGINWQVVRLSNDGYRTGHLRNNEIFIFGQKNNNDTNYIDVYMATANAQANILERAILSFNNAKDALNNTTN